MTRNAADGGEPDLAMLAGDRPAPPSPSPPPAPSGPAPADQPSVVVPVSSARPDGPRLVRNLVLELGSPPVVASEPRPFGRLVSGARGVLGRSAGLTAAAAGRARAWRGFRFRASASLPPVASVQASPGDTLVAPQPSPRRKKSWREQRWERRRKRRVAEEVLGWILVPIILISLGWAVKSGLNALGTTPTALIQGFKAALSGKS